MQKCRIQLPISIKFYNHIFSEARYKRITIKEGKELINWLTSQPIVVTSGWFKKLSDGGKLVGYGPNPVTVLSKDQVTKKTDIEVF